jgi:hypothetical protein
MKIKTVTITGADDKTDINKMIELSNKYPFIEWGILFSVSKQGNTPRYPSINWITKLLDAGFEHNMSFSAHLCGEHSRNAIEYTDGDSDLLLDIIYGYSFIFNRVQLNFNARNLKIDYDTFSSFVCGTKTCIIQHNESNKIFCDEIIKMGCKVHFLYDGSGGRGNLPKEWKPKINGYFTGYAGGLNPENIAQELHHISTVNSDEIWVDTETGVRTNDVLDFDKVEAFLKICQTWN